MSTAQVLSMIDAPVMGHSPWAYANYDQQLDGFQPAPTVDGGPGHTVSMDVLVGGEDFARPGYSMPAGIEDGVYGQVLGHSGPSLDSYPTVRYRGDRPGFGDFNDQPMFSGRTNFSPGVDPSEEVGTGKPPGWVQAHMPVAEGINPVRFSYAQQGVFADGGAYFVDEDPAARQHENGRQPWWPATQNQPGQDPNSRAMWPGSAVLESAPSMSLSEILGRVTGGRAVGWGVQ